MKLSSLFLSLSLLTQAAAPSRAFDQDAAKSVQTSPGAAAQPLRNEDVLKMIRAGLSPEAVGARIRATAREFDTSPAALQSLKAAGVPDDVIVAMVTAPPVSAGEAAPPSRVPRAVAIPAGTLVDIEAAYDIDSQNVKEGDALSFRVVNPVKVGGVTVIEAGATATGRVERAKRGGHWGRAGLLVWGAQYVNAADGTRVALQPMTTRQRGDSKGAKVATQMVVTGALIPFAAPLALLHGFKRGGNAVIPAGRRFEVFVRDEARVQVAGTR